ncbi:hypothetical protein ACQUY5_16625 [Bacillus cereus]|uniref:hypothetical protein n=1 Tax=Bacillus cereus TaxID=1396 RepID=UPI003D168483
MIKVNRVLAKNSEEEVIYVYNKDGRLLLDGADKYVFEEWSEFVGVELPKESVIKSVMEIQATSYEVNREIEIKEYMHVNEIPEGSTPIVAYVEQSQKDHNKRILAFVQVGEHKTTMYKPSEESEFFVHPKRIVNREAYDNLPQIYLYL